MPPRTLFEKIYDAIFPFRLAPWIRKNTSKGLYLSKSYSQTGSLSFVGGSPIAPSGFQWPIDESYQLAEPFLA